MAMAVGMAMEGMAMAVGMALGMAVGTRRHHEEGVCCWSQSVEGEEAALRLLKGTLNLWAVYAFPPTFVL